MGRALLVLESPQDRQKAVSWINKAPVGTRVEFKASKRSLPQNDLMWALLTEVSQQYEHNGRKYDPTSWKAIFLHAFGREISFLPSLDMKTFLPIELSSSDLSKDEMTNFIEFIIKEGTERGVIFRETEQPNSDGAPALPSEDDAAPSPSASSEPADDPSPSAGSTNTEPDMFGKLQFGPGEKIDLQDLARKALDDADGYNDVPAKVASVAKLFDGYDDVIESDEGRKAMEALKSPIAAVINCKRTREQAAAYIAREILDCSPADLEGRK